MGPCRLAWPRTPAFHVGNTGSNPVGDTSSDIVTAVPSADAKAEKAAIVVRGKASEVRSVSSQHRDDRCNSGVEGVQMDDLRRMVAHHAHGLEVVGPRDEEKPKPLGCVHTCASDAPSRPRARTCMESGKRSPIASTTASERFSSRRSPGTAQMPATTLMRSSELMRWTILGPLSSDKAARTVLGPAPTSGCLLPVQRAVFRHGHRTRLVGVLRSRSIAIVHGER